MHLGSMRGAGDDLHRLGMDDVKTVVNIRKLIAGPDVPETARTETSGSLGNIYLSEVPGPDREKVKAAILPKHRCSR